MLCEQNDQRRRLGCVRTAPMGNRWIPSPQPKKGYKKDIAAKSLEFQGFFSALGSYSDEKKILNTDGFELPEIEYCYFVHRKTMHFFVENS